MWKNRRASREYLIVYFKQIIEDQPKMTCGSMVDYAKKHLKLEINETIAKRVKKGNHY